MLNFLKTFEQEDANRYSTQIRNTTVVFLLRSAIAMDCNVFHINNKTIGATFQGTDWKTVETIINMTDPATEDNL